MVFYLHVHTIVCVHNSLSHLPTRTFFFEFYYLVRWCVRNSTRYGKRYQRLWTFPSKIIIIVRVCLSAAGTVRYVRQLFHRRFAKCIGCTHVSYGFINTVVIVVVLVLNSNFRVNPRWPSQQHKLYFCGVVLCVYGYVHVMWSAFRRRTRWRKL